MASDSKLSFSGDWCGIEKILGGAAAIDGLARSTGALARRREVRDGSQLLRLALGYAATDRSLRTTAGWSGPVLGVHLSDVALLNRLREAGDFLAALSTGLLAQMVKAAVEPPERWTGPPIRLVDSSIFAGPGHKGGQHRLHASYDPARQIFTAFDVTSIKEGESLARAGIEPGEVAVSDRNYAKTQALRRINDNQAFFVVRAGIRSARMIDVRNGERLTSQAVLAALGQAEEGEIDVELIEAKAKKGVKTAPVKARLVILRAGQAAATREKARIERSRTKHQAAPTKETRALAGVIMILTNLPQTPLPETSWPIARVALVYRLRWQIELAFKTLKSIFAMRDTPAKDPRLARTWILANLAAAFLSELLISSFQRAVPPSHV
jgi:hypothetical protein